MTEVVDAPLAPVEDRLVALRWYDTGSGRWEDSAGYQVGDLVTFVDETSFAPGQYVLRHAGSGLLMRIFRAHRTRQQAVEHARFLAWRGRMIEHDAWRPVQNGDALTPAQAAAVKAAMPDALHMDAIYRTLTGMNVLDEQHGQQLPTGGHDWWERNPLQRTVVAHRNLPFEQQHADELSDWLDRYIVRYGPATTPRRRGR